MTERLQGKVPRRRFIRLGAAVGLGAAATALTACGGGSEEAGSGDGGGASQAPEETTQAAPPEQTAEEQQGSSGGGTGAIATEDEVAPGSAKPFQNEGNDAVLVRLESGDFVAYSAVCTHQQCTVAYRDAQLACPCHGSIFDPANGAEVVNGPAPTPLPEIPVEVRDGAVYRA